jgi:D-aspartate ligase
VGRPTGRSAIAELGGVELLYTMYCDLAGLPLPPDRTQRYGGVKWVYLRRDVQSAVHYWRAGQLSLLDWARSWRGLRRDAVFAWRDQRPFWTDLAGSAKEAGSALRRRLATRS